MGTRHIIAVMQDGIYKIGQYGQWDGDIGGQGIQVLGFLKTLDAAGMQEFRRKVAMAVRLSPEQRDGILEANGGEFPLQHAALSRNTGAQILGMLQASPGPLQVYSDVAFIGSSLMCEWAYVIDLDRNTFEVFEGFNESPTHPKARFPSGSPIVVDDRSNGYHPCRLIARFKLDDLPSDEMFLEVDSKEPTEFSYDRDEEMPPFEVVTPTRVTGRAIRL